jgi:hypothetical protein
MNLKFETFMPLQNQVNEIIYISICSTHHALSKYVKIFENFFLIIRDIAIVSELCMEFGKKTYFVCKCYLSYYFFSE